MPVQQEPFPCEPDDFQCRELFKDSAIRLGLYDAYGLGSGQRFLKRPSDDFFFSSTSRPDHYDPRRNPLLLPTTEHRSAMPCGGSGPLRQLHPSNGSNGMAQAGAFDPSADLAAVKAAFAADYANLAAAAASLNYQNKVALGVVGSIAGAAVIVVIILAVLLKRARK